MTFCLGEVSPPDMDLLLTWFGNHPLVAFLLIAIAMVVCAYFIRKHFVRIIIVGILTVAGYFLYLNGYFSKTNIEKLKKVSFTEVEQSTEQGLKKGYNTVRSIDAPAVEKKADQLRDETRKEMMPHLKDAHTAKPAAKAAAPAGAKNKPTSAAGGVHADSAKQKKQTQKKKAPKSGPAKTSKETNG